MNLMVSYGLAQIIFSLRQLFTFNIKRRSI